MLLPLSLILTITIVFLFILLYLKKILDHRFVIPRIFKEIQDRFPENMEQSNHFLKNIFIAATDIFQIKAKIFSRSLIRPASVTLSVTSNQLKVHIPVHITNASPTQQTFIEINQPHKNIQLICESPASKKELEDLISPRLLDTLMELLMVETSSGWTHDIHITAEQNTVHIHFSRLPKNSRHLQLLAECALGLNKALCTETYLEEQSPVKRGEKKSSEISLKYLNHSLYFLILFSIILFIQIGLLINKKNEASALTKSFKGTVILKKIINENEYYLFLPHKVRVTQENFESISEGNVIEKVDGQKMIDLIKEEPPSGPEQFLDLL